MIRTCPHCQHSFEDQPTSALECPRCQKALPPTVLPGAQTLDLDLPTNPAAAITVEETSFPTPAVRDIAPTVEEIVAFPSSQSAVHATDADDPHKTVAIDQTVILPAVAAASPQMGVTIDEANIGLTVQQGKWQPSPEEIAAAMTVDQPIDAAEQGSFGSGITPNNLRDLTILWGNVPPESVGLSPSVFEKSPTNEQADGSNSQRSSSAASSEKSESLEMSLVIQPRVLREQSEIAPPVGERIDYNLLKKLGEGGMGIVYAARQASIRRTVALKMLKAATSKEARQREKFLAEAVITGDLEHPNIVPIYDLGRDETGAIFYAMKHVKGTPWDKLIAHRSLTENLEILMKVADGVAFAHSRRVIHRDLKPENVMLGGYGEVLVMDWGLALALDHPPAHISMGGTPAYMAPEMATGPIAAIGVASDVYLLGAILFEIVTGKRPHSGSTLTKCLMAAANNEIVPTQHQGELIQIALHAMASVPEKRYRSVGEFQHAIRTYQSHTESIVLATRAQHDLEIARQKQHYDIFARALFGFQESLNLWQENQQAQAGIHETSQAYAAAALAKEDYDLGLSLLDAKDARNKALLAQLRQAKRERESRQNRLLAARRIGVALVATIFFIVTGAFFWIRAEAERARQAEGVAREAEGVAKTQRETAVEQKNIADQQRAAALLAQQEAEKQRQTAEEQRAAAVAARQAEEVQRQAADRAREQEEYEAYIARLGLAAAKIQENAYDHAHELLQACPPRLRHWEWGRLAFLCEQQTQQFDCGQPLEALAVTPDGKRIAVGGWGGKVRIITLGEEANAQPLEFATGAEYVFALAFSPDGEELAIGTNAQGDYLAVWNPQTGERLQSLKGHRDAVVSIVYSRDGKQLLTSSYDKSARLWNRAQGTAVDFLGHDWWVWSARFSPDERRIVTASQDGTVLVWPIATRKPSPPFMGHTGPVYGAAFAPDGERIASAGHDRRILLWNPADLKEQSLEQALRPGAAAEQAAKTIPLEGHTAPVRSVQFSADGKLLLSGSYDNTVALWDPQEAQLVKKFRGHGSRVSAALFSPTGERLLSASYDHRVCEWSISRYEEMRVLGGRVLQGHRDAILGGAFSPDGKIVVTASRDRSAMAWDVGTGQPLQKFREGHAYLASTALFFPDGKRVLTAAVDNTARIWDLTTGTQIVTLEGTGPHAAAALVRGGTAIITGSDDHSLKIWDAHGKLLQQIPGFKSVATALAVSADQQLVLAGDGNGRCRLLRVETGETLWEAHSHSRAITAAHFLPRGKVLTASLDHTVAVWDLATGKEDRAKGLKHPEGVTSLAVNSAGTRALTSAADRIVRLWDLERATVLHAFPATEVPTADVVFTRDDRRALCVGGDNRLHLWDLETFREITTGAAQQPFLDLSATTLLAWGAAYSADGEQLLTVGGNEAHLWDVQGAKLLMTFSPQSAVASVQFSNDGQKIITGGWDNAARVWNSASGSALIKLSGVHTRFVNASAFSPDGKLVITASDDGTAQLWDAASGKALGTLTGHTGRVTDVSFSSDGQRALTASDDKTARIWNLETQETVQLLRGHQQGILAARFAHDDARVLTGSEDTTAIVWNSADGQPLAHLKGHTASVTSVAFTPDGLRALTGSKDITAKLWDPATGKEVLTLNGHSQEITTVGISRHGDMIFTGSRDGTAIIWKSVPWKREGVAKR